jgi:hypothetical protein
MISFKPYLFGEKDAGVDSAYRRIIGLFLQGIALHAVEGDKNDFDRFRADIDSFGAQIGPETPMSECWWPWEALCVPWRTTLGTPASSLGGRTPNCRTWSPC